MSHQGETKKKKKKRKKMQTNDRNNMSVEIKHTLFNATQNHIKYSEENNRNF